ncbi:hypothetical protein TRAPUB_4088 [Trametes pubescens]|uniref:Uncharacterized protein n=1 Tax=Trametes pubescens TaxID=154538 RepID=A0A1M2VC68_TRAPU|nr:hypothetical protein TRAPUB_4088 [Trametes pubescens]
MLGDADVPSIVELDARAEDSVALEASGADIGGGVVDAGESTLFGAEVIEEGTFDVSPPPVTPECGAREGREAETETSVMILLMNVLAGGKGEGVFDVAVVEGGTVVVFMMRVIAATEEVLLVSICSRGHRDSLASSPSLQSCKSWE